MALSGRVRFWGVVIGVPLLGALGAIAKDLLDGSLAVREQRASEARALVERDLKIYEYAVDSLEQDDARRQLLAISLAQEFMSNRHFQEKVLSVLESQGTTKEVQNVATFAQEERGLAPEAATSAPRDADRPAPAAPPASGAGWRDASWDLFYCESPGASAARQVAEHVAQEMRAKGARGRIRVRLLPAAVNDRAGYRVSGDQVRVEESETEMASRWLEDLRDVLPAGVATVRSHQPTPGYVSVFFCPERPPPSPP